MIYLDNNATTPIAPEVQQGYLESLHQFGNASSIHQAGQAARRLVNESREVLANLLHVSESSLVFTSGGTESLNAAMLSTFISQPKGKHLIVSRVEHSAVLQTARFLESLGTEVTYLPVDSWGRISLDHLVDCLRPETQMVAVMFANNETGNLYPVEQVGHLLQKHNVLFLCDGVQAVGKVPLDLSALPVDFLAASAHKFHGPKGVGFLYVKKGVALSPLIRGGRQERGKRAGTENVPGIYAMAQAFKLAMEKLESSRLHVLKLRDQMEAGIIKYFPDACVLGDRKNRLPGTLNIFIPEISGETALMKLDLSGVAISIGAACESGSIDPSHVLKAMGYEDQIARSGLRFSFSRYNTSEEVQQVLELLKTMK